MTDLLFVRPADDSAAIQVAAWGQILRQMVSGFSIVDLSASQATRRNIDTELASGVRHLFYFGHGTPTELIAHSQAVVDSTNLRKLANGMVIAIACYAGDRLGQIAGTTHPNVRAFLGLDDELGFPAKAPFPTGLAVRDGLMGLLLQRHDIGRAGNELRQGFDRARVDYKTNGARYGLSVSETRTAWLFAKSNKYSVRVHGDSSTTL